MTDTNNGSHQIERILVGLDGSPLAETILPAVRDLARRSHAELCLLHVVHTPMAVPTGAGIDLDEVVAHAKREALSYLRRLADEIEADGITVRTAVAVGDTGPEIARFAERESVDLIALATHGRSGMRRWFYGSVADAVLHIASRPLLLLRPTGDAPAPFDVRRVVVALDGSSLAEEALVPARELASTLGAPLVLLRVVDLVQPTFVAGPFGGAANYSRLLASLEDDAERYLAHVAARERGRGLTVATVQRHGAPADVIAQYGEKHPDSLLVLGTHGRSGWRAAVLGSVARRVMLMAHAPLLLVRMTPPTGMDAKQSARPSGGREHG